MATDTRPVVTDHERGWIGRALSDHARWIMDERGLTVADLASMIGRSPGAVRRRLSGQSTWYVCEWGALAAATGTDPRWWINEDNI